MIGHTCHRALGTAHTDAAARSIACAKASVASSLGQAKQRKPHMISRCGFTVLGGAQTSSLQCWVVNAPDAHGGC